MPEDFQHSIAPAPSQHDLDERVDQLERQVQEHLDGWKRAKADYLNLKKQTDKEKAEIAQFAQATAVMEFLPVYDNLKRAEQHIPEDRKSEEWVKGIIHIQKQFEDVMKSLGLEPIPTVGQPFDPNRHHAVSKKPQEGVAPGIIIEELKSGFLWNDRVLAPAQVIVAE